MRLCARSIPIREHKQHGRYLFDGHANRGSFGLESPAQSDRLVLQTAGMPDWLVCDSDEVYFNTAMRLISEPELRASVSNHSTREQIRQRLFEDQTSRTLNPFADVLHHVYQHHTELESSGQKVFYYEDFTA